MERECRDSAVLDAAKTRQGRRHGCETQLAEALTRSGWREARQPSPARQIVRLRISQASTRLPGRLIATLQDANTHGQRTAKRRQ
jgi:hypothetical protein